MSNQEKPKKEIPTFITDPNSGCSYIRGKLLGKGGFARCYEMTDEATKVVWAGKIVSKSLLLKPHQKEKMSQEISIHRSLNDHNVVGFHSFFEDQDNVYIILELCKRRSMMELHKRRKVLLEPEVRYFMLHLLNGVLYLHKKQIIHRDLKLGNLFLNDDMEVKIGDFGLATRLDYVGERKKTLCGTPNYIAPEVLTKKGHSFEVDIWSIGCILYTLLVGKPPFETQTLKDTYQRIRKNEYHIPSKVTPEARALISKLLHGDPAQRPSCEQILNDVFFRSGFKPVRLPVSCLTMTPRFDKQQTGFRKPLTDINIRNGRGNAASSPGRANKLQKVGQQQEFRTSPDCFLGDLYNQVDELIKTNPDQKKHVVEDDAEDPNATPLVWVIKWVDYSDKYGLGYTLCDDSIGVLFNDLTKILLMPDEETVHYIDRDLTEHYHTMSNSPQSLYKKITLLRYFKSYMTEHLMKTCGTLEPREGDEMIRMPTLRTYFRTKSAIMLHLTNGTFQINFFEDHTKIILCPLMGAVTYIDKKRNSRTFKFDLMKTHGCSGDLGSRLRYAHSMVRKMINNDKLITRDD